MANLQKRSMIGAVKRSSKFTIFEVINWLSYQQDEVVEVQQKVQQKGQQKVQQRSSRGPHIKNEENVKNVKTEEKYYVEGENPLRLATYLLNCIRKNRPEFKEPDLQKWALHVDYMLRLDKRDPDQVREVIKWAQADNQPRGESGFCWAANILSTRTLREKFDQLAMKMPGQGDDMDAWLKERAKGES